MDLLYKINRININEEAKISHISPSQFFTPSPLNPVGHWHLTSPLSCLEGNNSFSLLSFHYGVHNNEILTIINVMESLESIWSRNLEGTNWTGRKCMSIPGFMPTTSIVYLASPRSTGCIPWRNQFSVIRNLKNKRI